MAQTFKDFVAECNMYPYSRENFELMKECSEVALTEKFIENQEFLLEHSADLGPAELSLTESYFQESASEETVTALMEEVQAKKKNIFAKIWKGFLNILKRIRTFFIKLANSMDDVGKNAAAALKALQAMTLTKEDVDALNGLIDDINANAEDNPPARRGRPQPFVSELKLKYASGAFANKGAKNTFENKLAVALSTTSVRLNGGGAGGAIPGEDLVAACKKLLDARKNYHANDVVALIEGATADANKNGLVLNANTKELQKIADQLAEIEKQVSAMGTGEAEAQESSPSRSGSDQNAELVAGINAAYGKITGCVGATITVYNQYMNHRRKAVAQIGSWVNSRNKSNPTEPKAD